METFDVLESQLWIGATALSPEEMAEAMDKTLRELGYAFDRIGEDIEYPPKKEMKVFKIKGPPLTIAFHWNVPVCSTYPLCPTLEECLWAYKPLGTVRITPVSEDSEPTLKRILSAWTEKLPRKIWRFNSEYLEYYVNEKGISRAQLMELNFLRKWARWGITEFPAGVEDLPEGCLMLENRNKDAVANRKTNRDHMFATKDEILESQRQPWIGMTGLLPAEMANATNKALDSLGYEFQREIDKYSEISNVYAFMITDPDLKISFSYFGPECPTYPLCPTLLECVWTKPIPLARVEPVNDETKPVLDRIFAKAKEYMPRDISEMSQEYKNYYRDRHGEQRNVVFKQCIQRKWSYWGFKFS